MDTIIHNVYLLPPGDGLADGHVGELECHYFEAASCQVQPVGLEVHHDRGTVGHERPVELAPRPCQPGFQPLCKPMCQPLCGVALRRGVLLDLLKQFGRALAVVGGHRLRAADEQGAQVHRLGGVTPSPRRLLLPLALPGVLLSLAAHGDSQGLHFFEEARLVAVDNHFIHHLAGFLGLRHHQLALPARLSLQVVQTQLVLAASAIAGGSQVLPGGGFSFTVDEEAAVGGQELLGFLHALLECLSMSASPPLWPLKKAEASAACRSPSPAGKASSLSLVKLRDATSEEEDGERAAAEPESVLVSEEERAVVASERICAYGAWAWSSAGWSGNRWRSSSSMSSSMSIREMKGRTRSSDEAAGSLPSPSGRGVGGRLRKMEGENGSESAKRLSPVAAMAAGAGWSWQINMEALEQLQYGLAISSTAVVVGRRGKVQRRRPDANVTNGGGFDIWSTLGHCKGPSYKVSALEPSRNISPLNHGRWIMVPVLLEPSSLVPHLPLLISLRAIHPVCTFASNNIQGTSPDDIPLNQQALIIISGNGRVQHCLPEPCQEERSAICAIHDKLDENVRSHLPDVIEHHVSRAWDVHVTALIHQVAEMAFGVYNEHLIWINVEVLSTDRLPLCSYSLELEWHAKFEGTVAEPATCFLNLVGWAEPRLRVVNAGEPHLWWTTFSIRQEM
ncbi:LOW QUALITY PROTEIN: hypothetical protein U9M48_005411 [Paspalum notatum var. saurae]|uniref:Uncharacterized protein n=1 Tax=Paspalum notatum var. saurae TaxID=547442 RepID=A0AAQ3SLE0_PASNO